MPVYSAKSGTQGAAPGPLPVPGPKLLRKLLHPAAFWRPGDFLSRQYCLMLSMESMIAISSRRGGGGRQTFPVPLSKEKRIPTPVCALARNDTENFQVLSLRGRTAPVGSKPSAASGRRSEVSEWPRSKFQVSAVRQRRNFGHRNRDIRVPCPPPFRQGRLIFPRVQAPPCVHKYSKHMKGKKR